MSAAKLRLGIVVVAYNAHATLLQTLDRIPADFRERIDEIIICDDASDDDTFQLGTAWATRPDTPRTHVLRHTKNLGYGGNQKAAYALAIEHKLDVVVLLHADGQYAPESLPEMLAPFEDGGCAAVLGSRMMRPGAAKIGGMPLYKRCGNRILTRFENAVIGTQLSEYHSGYRAYSTDILAKIPFEANSNGFDFDTQVIAQVVYAGGRIVEVPIPTYYGDEICYVNGLKYAYDVVKDALSYRLAVTGLGVSEWVPEPKKHEFKEDDGSAHAMILEVLSDRPPSRILDLGFSGERLAEKMRVQGHFVVSLAELDLPGVNRPAAGFVVGDLADGVPQEVGAGYDFVVAGDVIEHVDRPTDALRQILRVLRPNGELVLSAPNFAHWYPRLRVALGVFGYDRRGILDQTHVRFFTRSSLRRMVRSAGFDIVDEIATGAPFPVLVAKSRARSVAMWLDRIMVKARPTFFAYQFVLRVRPHAGECVHSKHLLVLEGSAGNVSYPTNASG